MKRTNIYLKESQLLKLKALSKKTGAVVAEHIRRAIDEYLLKNKLKIFIIFLFLFTACGHPNSFEVKDNHPLPYIANVTEEVTWSGIPDNDPNLSTAFLEVTQCMYIYGYVHPGQPLVKIINAESFMCDGQNAAGCADDSNIYIAKDSTVLPSTLISENKVNTHVLKHEMVHWITSGDGNFDHSQPYMSSCT